MNINQCCTFELPLVYANYSKFEKKKKEKHSNEKRKGIEKLKMRKKNDEKVQKDNFPFFFFFQNKLAFSNVQRCMHTPISVLMQLCAEGTYLPCC